MVSTLYSIYILQLFRYYSDAKYDYNVTLLHAMFHRHEQFPMSGEMEIKEERIFRK